MNILFSKNSAVITSAMLAATPALSEGRPIDLIVLADLTETLAVSDSAYTARAAELIAEYAGALDLEYEDQLHLRVANGSGFAPKPTGWDLSVEFSHQGAQAEDIPDFLEGAMADLVELPKLSDGGLYWALDALSDEIDCATREVHVIVLGTGESLTEFTGSGYRLPPLPGTPLEGCEALTWIGIAAQGGYSIAEKAAVEAVWIQLGESLGARHVDIQQ